MKEKYSYKSIKYIKDTKQRFYLNENDNIWWQIFNVCFVKDDKLRIYDFGYIIIKSKSEEIKKVNFDTFIYIKK